MLLSTRLPFSAFHPDNWNESLDDCRSPDSRDTKPASEPCCRPPRLASSQQMSCRRGRNQTLCPLFLFLLFGPFRDTGICSSHSAAAGTPLHALSTLLRAPPSRLCTRTRFLARTPLRVIWQKKRSRASLPSCSALRGVRFGNGARVVTDNRKGKKKKDADDVRCCEVSPPVVVIVCPPIFFPAVS